MLDLVGSTGYCPPLGIDPEVVRAVSWNAAARTKSHATENARSDRDGKLIADLRYSEAAVRLGVSGGSENNDPTRCF